MSWLAGQDLPDVTVCLAWKTWRFWWLQGHADELARFSAVVLAKRARLAPHQRALALAFGAFESMAGGDNDRAQGLFEQSMTLFRQTGDKLRVALIASVSAALLEDNGSGWLHAFLQRDTRGDDARSALRSRLSGQAFEAAWSYGRALGAKRAVEYALQHRR